MTTALAARMLQMHPKDLTARAKLGRIPFTWAESPYGQAQRDFSESAIRQYGEQRREALAARLAKLDGGAAA